MLYYTQRLETTILTKIKQVLKRIICIGDCLPMFGIMMAIQFILFIMMDM